MSYTVSEGFLEKMKKKQNEKEEREKKEKKIADRAKAIQEARQKKLQEEIDRINGKETSNAKAFEEKFGYAPIDFKTSPMTYAITPTPEEDEGFFKAGAFDDGYQFGDVTKTVIGTAGDFLGNAAKGFWNMFEGVADTILYGASGVANLVGAEDAANYLKNEANFNTVEKGFAPYLNDVDEYSVLGNTLDSVAQGVGNSTAMMLPGGVTQSLGLGTKAAGLATTGMTFVSGFGSGMSEAYNSGATDIEAVVFSILNGAVEAGTEALFGGIGKAVNAIGISKGVGGFDDQIANALTKKLTNQTVKSLAKFGIKSAGEGVEEVLAGLGTAVAKKLSYMSEEDIGKLIEDENLMESFVVGLLSSAISQSPDVVNSVKTGRDFVTNYTQDEQKVIDKVIENKIAEAEKNGKKLTNKEKSKIAEEAKTYVERGYVSVKELEDILGDKTELDALNKEYEEFNKLYESKPGDLSKKDTDRLAELESKYKEQSYEDRVKAALGKISTDVYNKANGGYLAETYREVERSKQDFQYDLSQYVGSKHYDAVKQTYENAVKAKANNTNAVHDLVDMNAKLSSETGLVYEYKTQDEINSEFIKNKQNEIRKLQNKKNLTDEQNKKLSALKQLVEDVKSGKVNIDGNIDVASGKVTLNVNSKKMLQITVGHELTHNLEPGKGKNSESYNAMRDAVFAYAESKGINIKNELEKKSLEYLGVEGADPEMELVADLVGEYLFTDSEFVNQLTTNNRNLAQRIYDKIKHLLKLATAGSKEARNLEKAKKAFEEAFRQNGEFTANSKRGSVRYSVGENITESQNEKGLNAEQEVSYSLANNSKYMEKAFAANDTSFNVERTLLEEAKAIREKVAERMNEIKDRGLVGLPEDIEGNTYIANSSYDGTEENTTICPRSLASEVFVDAVSEYLGRPLSVEEQIYISQDLQGRSLTPECTYCYVATDRKAYRAFLGEYIKQRDSVIEKIKVNPDADVSVNGELYKEFLNGRKPTPQMYSRFKMWVDAYKNGTPMVEASHLANINKLMGDINSEFGDVLKPQITDAMKYAQAASWAKKRVNYVAYNGHILNWKQDRINKLNSHYGLRMYSFSDFHPAFVLENMQMITDASVRGLKMLGYTKDIDFVDIFAPTGMNINVSTFGFESGGNVYENNLIGAEWEKAKALREQYPNVGITFVATNDTLVNWALEQDWIDVVIPYHLVRTGAEVAKAFNYTNYTSESSDTKDIGWTKGNDKKYIAPTEHNNDKATYLAALKKNHLKPRFERFIDNPNYMKLVNECRQSASESEPVKPVFNEEAAMVALAKLEANGYYQPIGGSVDRMYEIASEVAENMIAPTKQSLSSSNKNAKPNIFNTNSGFYNTERSNETTVDAPVAEESAVTEESSVAPVVSKAETTLDDADAPVVNNEVLEEKRRRLKIEQEHLDWMIGASGDYTFEKMQTKAEIEKLEDEIAALEGSIAPVAEEIAVAENPVETTETEEPLTKVDQLRLKMGELANKAFSLDSKKNKTDADVRKAKKLQKQVDEINLQIYEELDKENPSAIYSKRVGENGWGEVYSTAQEALNAAVAKVDRNLWDAIDKETQNSIDTKNAVTPMLNALIAVQEDVRQETITPIQGAQLLSDAYNFGGESAIRGLYNPANGNLYDRFLEKAKQYDTTYSAEKNVTEPNTETVNDIAPVVESPKVQTNNTGDIAPTVDTGKPKGKQRKWIKTSTQSEVVDGKILPEDLDQELIHYEPISNKKTLANANATLNKEGYDRAVIQMEGKLNEKKVTLDDIALGERLIQEAIKRGDTKTAGDLITEIAILGTELGQKVQALSIIKRLTPEGQLKMLQRTVERGKAKGDKAFEGVELTQEMIDQILKTYNNDGTYDQAKLNAAVEDVKKKIADQMKVTIFEKMNAWRYLSMLGNPKTHIRNLVSNVAMRGTLSLKNALARTGEAIFLRKNGIRTKTWKSATDDVKSFAKLSADERQRSVSDGKYNDEASIKSKRRIFKNKVLNAVYEFNSDMLSKEDWWFSKPVYKQSLQEFLTANGIKTKEDIENNKSLVEKAKLYAEEQAQIATFQQYSWLANKINEIENKNAGLKLGVNSVLPFKKTPINIAKTGLNYSPLGFAKTLTYDIYKVKKGEMQASELVDHLSQNVTGSALTLVGYMLAMSGLISGGGDDDKEGKYDYQLGEQSYSLNIGGHSFSLSWLSPVAMPLFVGANAYEQLVEGKEWNGNVVIESLAKTLDPLSEMSFISSLNDVLSSYNGDTQAIGDMLATAAQSYASQYIPTALSQIATVTDDTKRTTKVASDSGFKYFDEFINDIKYKIPGLRQTLEPSLDIWGNEIKLSDNAVLKATEAFLAPYSRKENITTAVDEEIKTVYRETGNGGVIPSVPDGYLNYKGEKYNMSASEATAFKKTYGQTAMDLMEDLFDTNMYQSANAEDKAELIEKVYEYSREEAKYTFFNNRGISYTNSTKDGVAYYKESNVKGAIENDMLPEEYDFYKEYPGKYAVSKSVGGYTKYKEYSKAFSDITADKDANGKTISGSRKDKVIDYINDLDVDYGQKLILFKSEYPADDSYNEEIVNYLVGRNDISREDTISILTTLGFSVSSDGRVSW